MENEKKYLYNNYNTEVAKIKRCREMVAKYGLTDNEKDALKRKMERCLKGRVA